MLLGRSRNTSLALAAGVLITVALALARFGIRSQPPLSVGDLARQRHVTDSGDARQVQEMSKDPMATKARAKAAVLGAFVADAATMPLHWIYAADQITKMVGEGSAAFFNPPSSPFYKYKAGQLSPYGAEALGALKSVTGRGAVEGEGMTADLVAWFKQYPGYLNKPSKLLVANYDQGKRFPEAAAPDDQAQCLVKVPVVVARYAGLPEMRDKVVEACRTHQHGSVAEEHALGMAEILERVVLGMSVAEAVEDAKAHTTASVGEEVAAAQAAQKDSLQDVQQAVQRFGLSCHLPGAFQSALTATLFGKNYTDAVQVNIRAAGDQASRSHCVGAIWAAAGGVDSIPGEWKAKVNDMAEIEELVEKLVAERFP